MSQTGRKSSRGQLSFQAQVCRPCSGKHSHMSSPQQWTNEQTRGLMQSLGVSPEGLVCRPCRQDVTRVLGSSSHTPRWEKNRENKCCIHQCSEPAFVNSRMASPESMNTALKEGGLKCVRDKIVNSTPLCKHHYHVLNNLLQPTQTNCSTCGTC